MNLRSKSLVSLGILATLLFSGLSLMAQGMGPGSGRGPQMGRKMGPMGSISRNGRMKGQRGMRRGPGVMAELRGLDLTPAQREQIRAIMDSNRPSTSEVEERKSVMNAIRGGNPTEAQKNKAKELAAKRIDDSIRIRQEVKAVLTADQIQALEQRRQSREQRKMKMTERRNQRRIK